MEPDLYNDGLRHVEAGEFKLAYSSFAAAVEADPVAWQPRYGRAYAVACDKDMLEDADVVAIAKADLEHVLGAGEPVVDAAMIRGRFAELEGDHETAFRFFLMAVGRSPVREVVEEGLAASLSNVLTAVEDGRNAVDDDVALCDRIEQMITVAGLPVPVRDDLLAEVLAARAFRRQSAGDGATAFTDLTALARIAPQHPRLPKNLPSDAASSMVTEKATGFDGVGGMSRGGTFTSELEKLFTLFFGDTDPAVTRAKFADLGQPQSRSILMFGPSGSGKTYVVRAFTGEYQRRHGRDLPLVKLPLNEVLGRFVGESESHLTELFNRAIAAQPSILFCDEVDGLGMSREGAEHWHKELTNHFLTQIDRLKDENAAVLFVGATNRIWSVDLALVRRFDRLIPVGLPDAPARRDIFDVHLQRMAAGRVSADVDSTELATASHGLTPGDIQKVVSRAADDALAGASTDGAVITMDRLTHALAQYRSPMHVQEWIRQSRAALNGIGQDDMVAELDRLYGPYLTPRSTAQNLIPYEAWTEEPVHDLTLLRRITWTG